MCQVYRSSLLFLPSYGDADAFLTLMKKICTDL